MFQLEMDEELSFEVLKKMKKRWEDALLIAESPDELNDVILFEIFSALFILRYHYFINIIKMNL